MADRTHAFPPSQWTHAAIRDALMAGEERLGIPTYADREWWTSVREASPTGTYARTLLEAAEAHRGEPVTPLPPSLFAEYERTGNRSRYEAAYFDRHRRLALATLSTCLRGDDRYLGEVREHVEAICDQSTWLLPAHLPDDERTDGLPDLAAPADHEIALFSARTAVVLAEVEHLLGDRLGTNLRDCIRREVDARVLTPFAERDDFHWLETPTGNWTAVCAGASTLAALHLETDRDRLARLVQKGVAALGGYLDTFGRDGATPEGLSYWNFGLSHYAMVADALRARTDGRLSLFEPPILEEIVRFPRRIELSPGRYVPFSDARETDDVDPFLACWAGAAFDVPELVSAGQRRLDRADRPFFQRESDSLIEALRTLRWCRRGTPASGYSPARETFLGDAAWWIARRSPERDGGLVLAAKGGHNGESHNHNDCGSFVVHARGESSLSDLGAGTYDRAYFGEDRYEALPARSLGHSVPYVDGCEQAPGAEHAATVLERTDTDDAASLTLELAECYPSAAGLAALERSFVLDRAEGTVTVTDEATFDPGADAPTFAGVFVSYQPIQRRDDGLVLKGDRVRTRVTFDRPPGHVEIERLPDAVDRSNQVDEPDPADVWRARVTPPGDGRTQRLRAHVVPEPVGHDDRSVGHAD